MNLIDKNTKVYYISTFLLFLASTMPHSILTVLFLKKGLYFLGEWNTIKKQGDNTECADSSTG